MKRLSAGDIVLKVLSLLLLTAAALKGHELLTVPVAGKDLWSWRPLLIFQVEFELALGIWLLSGLFKRLAWLAGLLCFGLCCCVTLYKGLTGAASCGCFGVVHVNPWVTLLAIDLPAVVVLILFRPLSAFAPLLLSLRRQQSIHDAAREFLTPLPSLPRSAATAVLGMAVLGLTTSVLVLNEPSTITPTYEALEPETWVGRKLPILQYVDVGGQLKSATWLILFYHQDCPDCRKVILQHERLARDWAGNERLPHIALVEVPSYGSDPLKSSVSCTIGYLTDAQEPFVRTLTAVSTYNRTVAAAWEDRAPGFDTVLTRIAKSNKKVRTFTSTFCTCPNAMLGKEVIPMVI
jgi:hypothetical protein